MDRVSKTCLVLIVLLLATIALRAPIGPQYVYAQSASKNPSKPAIAEQSIPQQSAPTPRYHEYPWVAYGTGRADDMASKLTELSNDGWQVVGVAAVGEYNNQVLVIVGR